MAWRKGDLSTPSLLPRVARAWDESPKEILQFYDFLFLSSHFFIQGSLLSFPSLPSSTSSKPPSRLWQSRHFYSLLSSSFLSTPFSKFGSSINILEMTRNNSKKSSRSSRLATAALLALGASSLIMSVKGKWFKH